MSSIQQKNMKNARKQENVSHTQEKIQTKPNQQTKKRMSDCVLNR